VPSLPVWIDLSRKETREKEQKKLKEQEEQLVRHVYACCG
jgi:hypothetical protein